MEINSFNLGEDWGKIILHAIIKALKKILL